MNEDLSPGVTGRVRAAVRIAERLRTQGNGDWAVTVAGDDPSLTKSRYKVTIRKLRAGGTAVPQSKE